MRTATAALLLFSLLLSGCDWFDSKKQPLRGERISVLSLDRQLEPDPALEKIAITLPAPIVNPDWPEAGGYPNHAMQHLALPDRLTRAWGASTGEGASRYTRVLAQPIIANGRVYAPMMLPQATDYGGSISNPKTNVAAHLAAASLSGTIVFTRLPVTHKFWRSIRRMEGSYGEAVSGRQCGVRRRFPMDAFSWSLSKTS